MKEKSYEELVEEYRETVVLRLRGKFYNAFDESAMIVGELLKYKVKRTKSGKCRVGFPIESLDKVVDCIKKENVNIIVFEGDDITAKEMFENNQYQNILNQFDVNTIEDVDQSISKDDEPGKNETRSINNNSENSLKQRTSFVQGQGITLENAIMDVQRVIEMFITQKKKIISVSLVENRSTELRDVILVQGIVVYEIR